MAEIYMKQREARVPPEHLRYLNENHLPQFTKLLGLELKAGDKAPESGGVPRLFIMDEKDPTPRSLAEAEVGIGSREFWQYAKQGKLFGYAAGEKEPVQIQLKGADPGSLFLSEPFTADRNRMPSRNYSPEVESPTLEKVPEPAARPGWFARLMHRIYSGLYKEEHETYEKNRRERERIQRENQAKTEEYERKVREAKEALDKVVLAMTAGAEKAYGQTRDNAEALKAEKEAANLRVEAKKKAYAEEQLRQDAAGAEAKETWLEDAVTRTIALYGPKPVEQEAMISANHYDKNSVKDNLPPIDLPEDLVIGKTKVGDRLFTNLAIHAQLDLETAKLWAKTKGYGDSPIQDLMSEGLTEEEAESALIQASDGMLIGDVIKDKPRTRLDQYFDCAQRGRLQAKEALEEYRKGNPDKLAAIITNSAKNMVNTTLVTDTLGSTGSLANAKLTSELLDLLEDDAVAEACSKKGLTADDIDVCVGADYLRELNDLRLKAETKLLRAAVGKEALDEADKKQCLHNIFKYRTANARLNGQMKNENSKTLIKKLKEIDDRQTAAEYLKISKAPAPGLENVKPLPEGTQMPLSMHAQMKYKKVPSALRDFEKLKEEADLAKEEKRQPEADLLDELADMTVRSLRLEAMPPAKLVKVATGTGGLSDTHLLAHQGKLLEDREKEARAREEDVRAAEKAHELHETAVEYDGPQAGN